MPSKNFDLDSGMQLCRLLADSTRLRLLALLTDFELSVAELTQILDLAQSRVSTHLGKLKDAELLVDRRLGAHVLYRIAEDLPVEAGAVWGSLRVLLSDDQLLADKSRAEEALRTREMRLSWAEQVAGRMELHYSPGRGWQALLNAMLPLLKFGDVLDIGCGDGMLADLLHKQSRTFTGLDCSQTLLNAAQSRLKNTENIQWQFGDMHALPFEDGSFDHVFLLHTLTFSQNPVLALQEAMRVLRPNGQLILSTLAAHSHQTLTQTYDHVQAGFSCEFLQDHLAKLGLVISHCAIDFRELKPPYFEVISVFGVKK